MKIDFLKHFKVDWPHRSYQVWVINTTVESQLYLWKNWRLLFPLLDSLVKLSPQQAFIRTNQSYLQKNQWLGFGRMKWNEENNVKWTTKYRTNNPEENKLVFFNTQIWAPDWNQVCDTGIPPDIFMCLYNYPTIPEIKEGLTIALPRSTYKKHKLFVDDTLTKLLASVQGGAIYESKRDWWGRVALRNNIEDMNPQELLKIVTSPDNG